MEETRIKNRRSGQTTRLVDDAVQNIFKYGKALIKDHYNEYRGHKELSRLVINRLENEHRITKDKLTIQLTPDGGYIEWTKGK